MKAAFACVLLLFSFLSFADPTPYTFAPVRGYHEYPVDSEQSEWLMGRLVEFLSHQENPPSQQATKIENLSPSDYIKSQDLLAADFDRALQRVKSGRILIVDSVVGAASRLGNPLGGKGVVEIGDNITFLESKIIRLAVAEEFFGAELNYALWSSPDNLPYIEQALKSMPERIAQNPHLPEHLKNATLRFLRKSNPSIHLLDFGSLYPMIAMDSKEFNNNFYRNLGAGELVPVLHGSGLVGQLGMDENWWVFFSNIDNDVNLWRLFASAELAVRSGGFELLQVHVPTTASGGSVYWVTENGHRRMIPLEEIEVSPTLRAGVISVNTNSVIMTGDALDPKHYLDLEIPFESGKMGPDGRRYFLPKVSLSDIGKHPDITTKVVMGHLPFDFFSQSKSSELLTEAGKEEIRRRILSWQAMHLVTPHEALELGLHMDHLDCGFSFGFPNLRFPSP